MAADELVDQAADPATRRQPEEQVTCTVVSGRNADHPIRVQCSRCREGSEHFTPMGAASEVYHHLRTHLFIG